MDSSELNKLLAQVKLDLAGAVAKNKSDYIEPQRYMWYGSILIPTGKTLEKDSWRGFNHGFIRALTQCYYEKPTTNFILHGHTSVEFCTTPTFCHLFGYWPDETNSPAFRKQFNMKWEKIYLENGWK